MPGSFIVSEERFRAVIEHSLDGLVLTDEKGTVLYASPATHRITGLPEETFTGRDVFLGVHPEDLSGVTERFQRLLQGPGEPLSARFRHQHADGSWRWIDAVGTNLLAQPGVHAIVVSFRDVTQVHEAEAARSRLLQQTRSGEERLMLLAEASSRLLPTDEPEAIFGELLDLARRLIPADACAVWRKEPDGEAWSVAAEVGLPTEYERKLPAAEHRLPDQPLCVENVDRVPAVASRRTAFARIGIRSLMFVPLRIADEAAATIAFYYREPHAFPESEVRVATALANLASAALTTAELYARQRRAHEEAERAYYQAQDTLARLAESERDLRYVMEHANCILWHAVVHAPSTDSRGFVWDFTYFDEQAAQRFLPLELLPGESYVEAFYRNKPQEDRAYCDRRAREAFHEGRPFYSHETRCRRSDGSVRWLYEETQVEVIGPGQWRAVGFCTDITERKRLEGELRRQMEALEQADRRKDQFLAMLAHELRNPLGAISNALHVLRLPQAKEDMRARALAILDRQVRHQRRMVDDLLDVSRITRGLMEIRRAPVDLVPLVRDTVEDIRGELDVRGIALQVELPEKGCWVTGDAIRLGQVVGNLLHNACKFTEAGGGIRVRVEAEALPGMNSSDDVSNPPHPSQAVVSVRDTGAGMAPELLSRIFESFVQGDQNLARVHGGLGLGLALARGLIELHGGTIEARSDGPGHGSEVRFHLPSTAAPREAEAIAVGSSPAAGPVKVLVVEDNPDVAESMRDLLEAFGYRVNLASSGTGVLELSRRELPQVILCDIGLPGKDGYEVAAEIRADPSLAGIRLAAVSGYGTEDDLHRSRSAGFEAHFTKPVTPADLLTWLREIASRT